MARGRFFVWVLFLLSAFFLSAGASPVLGEELTEAQLEAKALRRHAVEELLHGRFSEAEAAYNELKQKDVELKYVPLVRLKYADIDLAEGKIDRAISEYKAVLASIELEEEKAGVYGKLGIAYIAAGDLESAEENLKKALKESTEWDDRTAAQTWLLKLSIIKVTALRTGQFSECGRDSLVIALRMLGREGEAAEVAGTRVESLSGLTAHEVMELARSKGVDCWGLKLPDGKLREITCPFIAHYGRRHFVVVTAVGNDGVSIDDPFTGKQELTLEAFEAKFSGDVIVFARADAGKGRVLTVAEATALRGGCATPVPPNPEPVADPEGDTQEPCVPPCCDEDTGATEPVNHSVLSPAYDIIPDIPGLAPLGPIGVGGEGNRFLGQATVRTIRRRGAPGGINEIDASASTSGGRSGWGRKSHGLARVGSTGCASCGGKGRGKTILPPDFPPKTHAKATTTFSVPSFNVQNLNVILPILPVYYNTGKGPDFAPSLIYYSQGTDEHGFGAKWTSPYQGRFYYSGASIIYIYTGDGNKVEFTKVGDNWVVDDGYNLKLTVQEDDDVELENPKTGMKYEYDSGELRVKTITDIWGQSLTIARSGAGKVTKVTTADSRESTFAYDGNSRCTKITSALGDTATFQYSAGGALTRVVDMGSGASTYLYDGDNYLTKRTTALGYDTILYVLPNESSEEYKVTYTSPDERARYLHWNANDDGDTLMQVKRGSYNLRSARVNAAPEGIVGWVPGGSGQSSANDTVTYDRDAKGNVTRVGKKYGASWFYTAYIRDGAGSITKVVYPDTREHAYYYDSGDKLTQYTTPFGTTAILRDTNGAVTKVVSPDSNYVEYHYDTDGTVTKYHDVLGNDTTFLYNSYAYLTKGTYAGSEDLGYEVDLGGLVTKFTDALSNSTTYLYDGYLRATKATFPDSTYAARTFNCCNLTAVRDTRGQTTTYSYDGDGTLTKITDPTNQSVELDYDDAYHLTKYTDQVGNTTSYFYDPDFARVTLMYHPNSTTQYYYLESGQGVLTKTCYPTAVHKSFYYSYGTRLTKINDGRADFSLTYDSSTGQVTRLSATAAGNQYIYYDTYGRITKLTDPRSADYTFLYNSTRQTTKASGPLSRDTVYAYDSHGRITKIDGEESTGATYYYDANAQATKVADGEGNETVYDYSNTGLVTKVTDPESASTTYAYDAAGRVTSVTDAASITATNVRDANGHVTRVTNALSKNTDVTRDAAGRVTLVTDANSKTGKVYYSNMRHITKAVNGNNQATEYHYATLGYMTKVVKPNGKATYVWFDKWGGITKWRQYYKVGTATDYDIWDHQQSFGRHPQGQVTKKTDFYEQGSWEDGGWVTENPDVEYITSSRDTTYAHDAGSLLTKIDYPAIADASLVYDAAGGLTRRSDSANVVDYTYDDAGRVTLVDFDYDSQTLTKSVSYVYDRASRRTKMTDGEGTNIVYSYDDSGGLTLVTEGGSTRAMYYYNPAGWRTKLTYGNDSYTEYSYDGAGRVTVVNNNKSDDTDISKFAYCLDDVGLRTKMSITGSAYTSADVAYLYDASYQLTKETRTGGSAYTQSFWYDSAGNRTKKNLGSDTVYYYDYIDRMTKYGTTAVTWDYWGNATGISTHAYSWDDSDRLTKFDHATGTTNDATYHYLPGASKRYKRIQDTTVEYFIYDGPNVVGSYASNGTLNARYVTASLDGNLSMTTGGSQYYYFQDGLGSVRNVVDSSEVAQNTYDYYAFGDTLATTSNVTTPYRFTAREHESGGILDTQYYRNRYYIAGFGIFTSRDALWADIHQGWGYVANLPTGWTDPYGLKALKPEELWDTILGSYPPFGKTWPSDKPVTPELLLCLFWRESTFDPKAKGANDDYGLGQMTPVANADVDDHIGLPKGTSQKAQLSNEPDSQIFNTIAYLHRIATRYGPHYGYSSGWRDPLRAYNGGPNPKNWGDAASNYADDILDCEKCLLEKRKLDEKGYIKCPSDKALDECLPMAKGKKRKEKKRQ